jgi:hypothetical protein
MNKQLNKSGIKKLYTYLESRIPGISKKITINGDHLVIDGLKMYISVPMEGVTDSPNGHVTGTAAGTPNIPKTQASEPTAASEPMQPGESNMETKVLQPANQSVGKSSIKPDMAGDKLDPNKLNNLVNKDDLQNMINHHDDQILAHINDMLTQK